MDIKSANLIIDFLEYYNKFFKELVSFLSEKERRVIGDDLVWLQSSLNEEQRMVMQISSLEQRRLKLFEQLGIKDFTSSQLIEICPLEREGRMIVECAALERSIDRVKSLNISIAELVERKLKIQAEEIGKINPVSVATYTGSGKKIGGHLDSEDIGAI